MGTQIHEQQISKRFLSIRLVIAFFIVLAVLVGTVFAIWHGQERWANIPIPTIVSVFFAVLSITFLLLQIYYPWTYSFGSARTFTPEELPPSPRTAKRAVPRKLPPPNYRVLPRIQRLPSTNPKIQKRQKAVKDLYTSLIKEDVTAIVLSGMAGVGKSTFAALVSKYTEEQRVAGNAPFEAEALWIKVDSDDTMIDLAKALFTDLKKPLPNFKSLDPTSLAEVLFEVLNTTQMARLVVIDQFDNLLDPQTGQVRVGQSGLREWIDLLNRRQCASRVLLVSRFWPQMAFNDPTTYLYEYHIKGLENTEGVELLQLLQIKGKEEELRIAVEHCEGHLFALRFLATFLSDYRLSLTAFVNDSIFVKLWLEDVAQVILDPLFTKQLSQAQQKLLRAFSIYREPMPLDAAVALIDFNGELTKAQALPTLDILLTQSLISEAGKSRYELDTSAYRLHALVTHYIQKHYYDDQKQSNEPSLQAMHVRAAQYYLERIPGSCPPREQRHSISDIQPIIEAFWQLCQASQHEQAYGLLKREHIFSDLRHWWKNSVLLDLYQMLLPLDKWHPTTLQELDIYNNLGRVYSELGQKREAKKYFQQALRSASDMKDQGSILNDLGSVCSSLGEKEEAQRYLEQALQISREIGDRKRESSVLTNLGLLYDELGKKEEAQKFLEQALQISREIGDHWEKGKILSDLGLVHVAMGKKDEGLRSYEQALSICKETGNRRAEVSVLTHYGQLYDELGKKEEAQKFLEQALQISREIGDRWEEGKILSYLGHVHTDLEHYKEALDYYEQALTLLEQVENHWEEGRTLSYLGHIYSDLEQHKEALDYYKQALRILEQVGDRWGEIRVLNNLGHLYSEFGQRLEAHNCFEKALHINREVRHQRREGGISHHSHRHHDDHRRTKEHLERAARLSREQRDRTREGLILHNLAHVNYEMGHKKDAHDLFMHALRIHGETGDRRRVGSTLNHIGELYLDQRLYEAALFSLLLAKMILEEVQSPDREKAQKAIEILHTEVGEQRFDELSKQVKSLLQQAKSNEDRIPELVQSAENVRDVER